MLFLWFVTPCGLLGRYQCFGQTCCQFSGLKIEEVCSPKRWYLPTSQHGVTNQKNIDIVSIALMMEAASISETSVNFYQTTRRNNPEDKPFSTSTFSPQISQTGSLLHKLSVLGTFI
jgi:hypothetical protein